MNLDVADYQWDYNEAGQPGRYLSQDELRQWFKTKMQEVQVRYDLFCQLIDIDEEIMRDWQAGAFSLKQGAFDCMVETFDQLSRCQGRKC